MAPELDLGFWNHTDSKIWLLLSKIMSHQPPLGLGDWRAIVQGSGLVCSAPGRCHLSSPRKPYRALGNALLYQNKETRPLLTAAPHAETSLQVQAICYYPDPGTPQTGSQICLDIWVQSADKAPKLSEWVSSSGKWRKAHFTWQPCVWLKDVSTTRLTDVWYFVSLEISSPPSKERVIINWAFWSKNSLFYTSSNYSTQ